MEWFYYAVPILLIIIIWGYDKYTKTKQKVEEYENVIELLYEVNDAQNKRIKYLEGSKE